VGVAAATAISSGTSRKALRAQMEIRPLEAFRSVKSARARLDPSRTSDTDQIIPKQFLKRTRADRFGEFLFLRLRNRNPSSM